MRVDRMDRDKGGCEYVLIEWRQTRGGRECELIGWIEIRGVVCAS